jgi:hypothetical protein
MFLKIFYHTSNLISISYPKFAADLLGLRIPSHIEGIHFATPRCSLHPHHTWGGGVNRAEQHQHISLRLPAFPSPGTNGNQSRPAGAWLANPPSACRPPPCWRWALGYQTDWELASAPLFSICQLPLLQCSSLYGPESQCPTHRQSPRQLTFECTSDAWPAGLEPALL